MKEKGRLLDQPTDWLPPFKYKQWKQHKAHGYETKSYTAWNRLLVTVIE